MVTKAFYKKDLQITNLPWSSKLIKDLELKTIYDVLDEAIEILNGEYFNPWLSAGTVLGLYRDDALIPHDTDIDLATLCFKGYDYPQLIKAFKAEGFSLQRKVTHEGEIMQLAFVKDFVLIDIYFYYSWSEKRFINCTDSGMLYLPKRFFDGETKFGDYRVPAPVDEYLLYAYGENWRIPETEKGDWVETCPCLVPYDV